MESNVSIFYGPEIGCKPSKIVSSPDECDFIIKTLCCNICGADINTFTGKRVGIYPTILGHEYVGELVRLPKGLEIDYFGNKLIPGDRVIFYIIDYCNNCKFCNRNLPQKCINQRKLGHSLLEGKPFGGFAEYLLIPDTVPVYKIPSFISNSIAASLSCPFATALEAIKKITHCDGKSILVIGSGLLSAYTVIILKLLYSVNVTVIINKIDRFDIFTAIGADVIFLKEEKSFHSLYYDCIIDTVGDSSIINMMVENISAFGEILLIGPTHPVPDLTLKPENIVRQCISIFGVHNYSPQILSESIILMEKNYGFIKILQDYFKEFPFSQIEKAFELAVTSKPLRVSINFNE